MRTLASVSVFVLLCVVAVVATTIDETNPQQEQDELWGQFEDFMVEHKRLYGGLQEKLKRFAIFKENMMVAERLNALHNGTAEFGVTQFFDLTSKEFVQKYLMSHIDPYPANLTEVYSSSTPRLSAPAAVDWQASGKVTPVRHQGDCGSCWAHCALGEIESRLLINNAPIYSLSVQQLVDCDMGSQGCSGGYENGAFSYIYNNGGVNKEEYYKYQGYRGSCRYQRRTDDIKLPSGRAFTPASTDPLSIYDFVAKGPATAALDATPLQYYRGGVLNLPSSSCPSVNHCVLIVGYNQAQAYFKIKNTWGTTWGEAGYFRINVRSCMVNTRIYGSSLMK